MASQQTHRWYSNADLILHRIQHLGGAATRERSRQRHAQHRFFPAGDPAAATWAHRNAAAGFDGHADARRWRTPFSGAEMDVVGAGPSSPPSAPLLPPSYCSVLPGSLPVHILSSRRYASPHTTSKH